MGAASDVEMPEAIVVLGHRLDRRLTPTLSPAWYEGTLYGHSISVWAPLPVEAQEAQGCNPVRTECATSWHLGPIVINGHGPTHQAAVIDSVWKANEALRVLRGVKRLAAVRS